MRFKEPFFERTVFFATYILKMLLPPFYSFKRLERYCKDYLSKRPKAYAARWALTQLYKDYNKNREAREELEILLREGYEKEEILKDLGEVCYRLRDYPAVLEYLEPVATTYSNDKLFNFYLGMSDMQTGAHEKALTHLTRALELPTKIRLGQRPLKDVRPHLYSAIGYCFFHTGQLEKAAQSYRKALALDPADREGLDLRNNVARAHVELANTLLQQGRRDEAVAQFRSALGVQPEESIVESILRTLTALGEDILSAKLRIN